MKDLFTHQHPVYFNNRLTKLIVTALFIAFVAILFMSYRNGPARNGIAATGAPFNGGRTCAQSGCHGGGTFGASVATQLLNENNTPVTSYEPGKNYTFRITISNTSGSPQYGFQTTVATATGNTNINSWATPPALMHISTVSGRSYIEHSTRLTTNVISLPWVAPAAQTGSVIFYTAANLVNANNATTGDQAVPTTLTITENTTLPVTLSYFKGTIQNGNAILNWATANEINNRNFIIEKSHDGIRFSELVTIPCKGNSDGSTYSYTDQNFSGKAYYRLKQTDFDGHTTVYNTLELKDGIAVKYNLSLYAHAGSTGLIFHNGSHQQKIMIRYNDLQGRLIYSGTTTANQGDNLIGIPPAVKNQAVIIVTVITEDGTRTSVKVGMQR